MTTSPAPPPGCWPGQRNIKTNKRGVGLVCGKKTRVLLAPADMRAELRAINESICIFGLR